MDVKVDRRAALQRSGAPNRRLMLPFDHVGRRLRALLGDADVSFNITSDSIELHFGDLHAVYKRSSGVAFAPWDQGVYSFEKKALQNTTEIDLILAGKWDDETRSEGGKRDIKGRGALAVCDELGLIEYYFMLVDAGVPNLPGYIGRALGSKELCIR